jgi:D-serine deaminase-like pyridoxal phosphate-dependent protein
MQYYLGFSTTDDIAVAIGWRVLGEDCYLSSLSQEHGIVKLSNEVIKNLHHGPVIGILPVHACLTVSCLGLLTSISGAALF